MLEQKGRMGENGAEDELDDVVSKALRSEEDIVNTLGDGKWVDPSHQTDRKRLADLLYHDSYFPQTGSVPPDCVDWNRISDLAIRGCSTPTTFPRDGQPPSQIVQGRLRDIWLLNALAIIAFSNTGRLRNIIVSDKHAETFGIYTLKFWINGSWMYVHVDDRIPCDRTGVPLFSHNGDPNETWVMIIEKAFAKIHRSYRNLEHGRVEEGLVKLLGCIPSITSLGSNISSHDLWNLLQDRLKDEVPHLLGVNWLGKSKPNARGLVVGHIYVLENIYQVHTADGKRLRFVKLLDPWRKRRWQGAWSMGDEMWSSNPDVKEELHPDNFYSVDTDEYTCFIELDDIKEYFENLYIATVIGSISARKWAHKRYVGKFVPEDPVSGAGGSPNDEIAWIDNPMVAFTLSDTTSFGCIVSHRDDPRFEDVAPENESKDLPGLGVQLCALQPGQKRVQRLRNRDIVADSGLAFRKSRYVGCYATLPKGDYVAVPCTFHKGIPMEFTLQLFVLHGLTDSSDSVFHIHSDDLTQALQTPSSSSPYAESRNDDDDELPIDNSTNNKRIGAYSLESHSHSEDVYDNLELQLKGIQAMLARLAS